MGATEQIALRRGLPSAQLRTGIVAQDPKMVWRHQPVDLLPSDHRSVVAGGGTKAIARSAVGWINVGAAVGNEVEAVEHRPKEKDIIVAGPAPSAQAH